VLGKSYASHVVLLPHRLTSAIDLSVHRADRAGSRHQRESKATNMFGEPAVVRQVCRVASAVPCDGSLIDSVNSVS
jgi:hypothetical protein